MISHLGNVQDVRRIYELRRVIIGVSHANVDRYHESLKQMEKRIGNDVAPFVTRNKPHRVQGLKCVSSRRSRSRKRSLARPRPPCPEV